MLEAGGSKRRRNDRANTERIDCPGSKGWRSVGSIISEAEPSIPGRRLRQVGIVSAEERPLNMRFLMASCISGAGQRDGHVARIRNRIWTTNPGETFRHATFLFRIEPVSLRPNIILSLRTQHTPFSPHSSWRESDFPELP